MIDEVVGDFVGCIGSIARHEGDFPRDNGNVHTRRYHCTGREERLVLCRSESSNCNREDSAGVICNGGEQKHNNSCSSQKDKIPIFFQRAVFLGC